MSDEMNGKGSRLQRGNTADHATSTTWTDIAEVVTMTPPGQEAEKIETTDLLSEKKEFIPGLPEIGDLEANIKYTTAQATTLAAAFNVVSGYRVLYPDGSGRAWTGWLMKHGEAEVKNGELITSDIGIACSGEYEHFEEEE